MTNLAAESGHLQIVQRLAYFSKNPFYLYTKASEHSFSDIITDAKRYKVPYFYYFHSYQKSNFKLIDDNGETYPEVTQGKIPGLLIFQIGDPKDKLLFL